MQVRVIPHRCCSRRKHGKVIYSSIGVIEKWKGEKQKLRFIHDLRTSSVNQHGAMHERIIVPRISDYIEDVLPCRRKLLQTEKCLGN